MTDNILATVAMMSERNVSVDKEDAEIFQMFKNRPLREEIEEDPVVQDINRFWKALFTMTHAIGILSGITGLAVGILTGTEPMAANIITLVSNMAALYFCRRAAYETA